jgi:hypothetical protein
VNPVSLILKFLSVGSHGGQKENDFMFMVFEVSAQTYIFGHKDIGVFKIGIIVGGTQLVTKNNQCLFHGFIIML